MYNRYAASTPPVVLNLIIINAIMLLATSLLPDPVVNKIISNLALFNVESPLFHSYQVVTYMFLHGGFSHLFFNMFITMVLLPYSVKNAIASETVISSTSYIFLP